MQHATRPVIYFDWDGTLCDSMDLCCEEIAVAMAQMGLPPKTRQQLEACNGPSFRESVAVLGIDPARSEEFLRLRVEAQHRRIADVLTLFPGVKEMLGRISAVADLVVVSNGWADYVLNAVPLMGVDRYFTRVQPFMEGKRKPEVLRMLLDEMQPEKCMMVGDKEGDIIAGKLCGIPTVAVTYGYGTPAECALADKQVDSVAALEALLMRFTQT